MEGERLKQRVAKVAKEELKEDENTRKQSLELFRDWVIKNPDITGCRTDDSFLLRFLRAKKFSVPLAQQMLINYINFKINFKFILYHLDINDRDTDDIISNGFTYVSPFRDDYGRSVIFYNFKNFDYKRYDWKTMTRGCQLGLHYLMEDEDTQVTGITYVISMEDSTPLYTLYPIRDLYNLFTHVEKSYPMRHQEINIINMSPVGVWFVNLVKSFLSEKLQKRFMIHDFVEDLNKHLNPKVLPKELGGTMPMAEMIAWWKKELVVKRESILLLDEISVKGESFKVLKDVGDINGIHGSFKKLQMD